MKLGILGTGMIVKDLLSTIHELAFDKVVLLATERSQKEAQEMVESYGLDDVYVNYDELLKSDVDTIYVALLIIYTMPLRRKHLKQTRMSLLKSPLLPTVKKHKNLCILPKTSNAFSLKR